MVDAVTEFLERCGKARFLIDPRADTASSPPTKLVFTKRETVREQVM